jgi:hypothetical protein
MTIRTTLLALLAAPLAALTLGSGVAQADTTTYLARVQQKLPYVYQQYGSDQLVTEGYRICGYSQQGLELSPMTDQVVSDLPMSRSAAIALETYAENYLGC